MSWAVVSFALCSCCVGVRFANVVTVDGFFDAGMLLQALKAKEEGAERPSEKVAARREVGKKLRLMEY